MLAGKRAVATVAVRDLEVARRFYEDALGLTEEPAPEPGAVMYRTGDSYLFVYTSDYAGTNSATGVTWGVGDDLEGIVETLAQRGVTFERYDLPDTTREGDIHRFGDLRGAWFKDPDGNIHAMVSRAS